MLLYISIRSLYDNKVIFKKIQKPTKKTTQKTKKTSLDTSAKTQNPNKCLVVCTSILAITTICLLCSTICLLGKQKTKEEQTYLDLFPYILARKVKDGGECRLNTINGNNMYKNFSGYGIEPDGNVRADFVMTEYDAETHEAVNSYDAHLYFQDKHNTELSETGVPINRYSEAYKYDHDE